MYRSLLAVITPCALLISACGDSSSEATYDSVEDLHAAVEDAGVTCTEFQTQSFHDDQVDVLACTEGLTLTTWDPAVTEEIAPKDGDVTANPHLRGETWDVRTESNEVRDRLAEQIDGEETSRSLDVLPREDSEDQ